MSHKLAVVTSDIARSWRCALPVGLAIGEGDTGVVDADRILDIAQVLSITDISCDPAAEKLPVLLRRATLQDQARAGENAVMARSAARRCREKIAQLKLDMQIVLIRYAFDRTRLTVFFTAEAYVDFRKLVQELATDLRCKIEMRQIGVRDAASMIGGLAPCGRHLCCSVYLRDFDNINIRMAKTQGLSLNPSTINGMCGRLKCCLRHEQNAYAELERSFPQEGAHVSSPAGAGKVIGRSLLKQRVRVLMDDQRVLDFAIEDVRIQTDRVPSQT